MAKSDEKTTKAAPAGDLQMEMGLPIAMCPVTDRLRPLGMGGLSFEAFWNALKEKDPFASAHAAHEQWRNIK